MNVVCSILLFAGHPFSCCLANSRTKRKGDTQLKHWFFQLSGRVRGASMAIGVATTCIGVAMIGYGAPCHNSSCSFSKHAALVCLSPHIVRDAAVASKEAGQRDQQRCDVQHSRPFRQVVVGGALKSIGRWEPRVEGCLDICLAGCGDCTSRHVLTSVCTSWSIE